MKLLILGDTHFSDRCPEKRTDVNFFDTQIGKFRQIIDIFKEYNCDVMLQPGDFFDSPSVNNYVISTLIELLREKDIKIYCVWGQHDVVGHSGATLQRSPLRILEAADVVKIVNQEGTRIGPKVDLYGCSYGCKVPSIIEEADFNILLIHAMIGGKELYPGQDIVSPQKFVKDNNEFNLVVCGDYHYSFYEEHNDCVVLNAGCLVRKTISERDLRHKPSVFICDVSRNICTVERQIGLSIEHVDTIFDRSEDSKKENSELLRFIESLKTSGQNFVAWSDILLRMYEKKNIGEEIKKLIDECMVEIRG